MRAFSINGQWPIQWWPLRVNSRAESKFFADVEYRDMTSAGLLRASSFKV